MADAALQRKNMVESQVRPSDVTDRRIMSAMMTIPRERFVPQSMASFAYSDETLTIAGGRTMLAPRVLAKLVQLADVEPGDKVLVVGSCCGYAAAILAQLANHVVALLPDGGSATATAEVLKALEIRNVVTVSGALASGSPTKAPYDVIFVEGGVETVSDALQSQLAEGGRLVAVGVDRRVGRAFLLHKGDGQITRRDSFQAAAPLLSGFEAARAAFVF
jgi:protein-L-isoaspartate(D-aspartate) O-methyltransferase